VNSIAAAKNAEHVFIKKIFIQKWEGYSNFSKMVLVCEASF
jgi:hypothetical protein